MNSFVDVFGDYTVPPSETAYSAITLIEDSTLLWPQLSKIESANQFFATAILEISAEFEGLRIQLPPAAQVSLGKDVLLRNVGGFGIQVDNSDGVSVTVLPTGVAKYVFTKDYGSNAWGVLTYGAGASGAEATELAGAGLAPFNNQLQIFAEYSILNTSRLLDFTQDRFKTLDIVTAGFTLDLPDVAGSPSPGFIALVRNSSNGTVLLNSVVSQTIDGLIGKTLYPRESCILLQANTGWVTVGYGRDIEFVYSETVVDVTSGDVVLTSAELAGRMIRVVGTPTANRLVTLPAVNNIYFVNVTAVLEAFTVGFRVGITSPVTLGANQSTALYVDGTRTYTAITTALTSFVQLLDGSANAPTLNFLADPDTGIYRKGNNNIAVTAGGAERFSVNTSGVTIVGTLDCGTL